jgi:hypothetical protein
MALTVEAQHRKLVSRMLGLYPALQNHTFQQGHRQITHVAHGWYMRVHRSAQAVLALDAKGFDDVAAPVRRCMLEHTVGLLWLAAEGDRIELTIKGGHQYDVENLAKALDHADWREVDRSVISEILAEPEPDGDAKSQNQYLKFRPRVVNYGIPADVPPYLFETGQSHPSWNSAAGYWDEVAMRPKTRATSNLVQPAVISPDLVRSLQAMSTMLDAHPWAELLQEAEAEMIELAHRQRELDRTASEQ